MHKHLKQFVTANFLFFIFIYKFFIIHYFDKMGSNTKPLIEGRWSWEKSNEKGRVQCYNLQENGLRSLKDGKEFYLYVCGTGEEAPQFRRDCPSTKMKLQFRSWLSVDWQRHNSRIMNWWKQSGRSSNTNIIEMNNWLFIHYWFICQCISCCRKLRIACLELKTKTII